VGHGASTRFPLIDERPKFLGELPVTKLCLMGSKLHGHREEVLVIALKM